MELYELSLYHLIEGLKAKKFSPEEVYESCKKRIDSCEENIHAFITRTDEIAKTQLNEDNSGILAGVPTVLKDNLCTQGIRTTAASKILGNWRPPYNASAWNYLRSAGAVLMGKVNMDEFAMGNTCGNSAFGATHNPNDLSRVPGGSSGGSAAAVSAGYVPFALGSDTGGSIRQPAAYCGVYGFKPTYGMVSRYGLISYGSSLDQIGPFARTIRDLQIVMSVIAQYDPMDSSCFRERNYDFTHHENISIKGKKVALVKEFQDFKLDPAIERAMKQTQEILQEEGAELVEVSLPVVSKYAVACYYALAMSEAHTNLERYDGVRYGYTVNDASGVKEMFERVRSYGFGPEVKSRIIAGTCLTEPERCDQYYVAATKVRTLIAQEFAKAFTQTDFILQPASPEMPPLIGSQDDDAMKGYQADLYTLPVNLAGLPGLSFFTGYYGDLPVGLQLIGKRWSDSEILEAGLAIERHTGTPQIANEGVK